MGGGAAGARRDAVLTFASMGDGTAGTDFCEHGRRRSRCKRIAAAVASARNAFTGSRALIESVTFAARTQVAFWCVASVRDRMQSYQK